MRRLKESMSQSCRCVLIYLNVKSFSSQFLNNVQDEKIIELGGNTLNGSIKWQLLLLLHIQSASSKFI